MKTKSRKQATPEQKEAAKARRAMITEVCKRISVMPKDTRAEIGKRLGIRNVEGHELSPYNQILLHLQRSSVSIVGGFKQWRATNRHVKKGAKALGIWIPISGAKGEEPSTEELTTGDEESTGRSSRFIIGKGTIYVTHKKACPALPQSVTCSIQSVSKPINCKT